MMAPVAIQYWIKNGWDQGPVGMDPLWTDIHDWKHFLPATSLEGGNNFLDRSTYERFSNIHQLINEYSPTDTIENINFKQFCWRTVTGNGAVVSTVLQNYLGIYLMKLATQ